jgi:hypothetical protein
LATYTVHEPPSPAADRIDRADELTFVRDGFSWPTALFPPLGFASVGLWPWVIGYFLVVGALAGMLAALGMGPMWISLLATALNIYLAFEVSTIQRWTLDRRGWKTVGTVNGKTLDECERRFMESWLPEQPPIVASSRDDQTTAFGSGGSRGANPIAELMARFKPSAFRN